MPTNITSLAIGGGYYCKINDGLYKVGYRFNLENIAKYIRERITDRFGLGMPLHEKKGYITRFLSQ